MSCLEFGQSGLFNMASRLLYSQLASVVPADFSCCSHSARLKAIYETSCSFKSDLFACGRFLRENVEHFLLSFFSHFRDFHEALSGSLGAQTAPFACCSFRLTLASFFSRAGLQTFGLIDHAQQTLHVCFVNPGWT